MNNEITLPTIKGTKFYVKKVVYQNYTTPVQSKTIELTIPNAKSTDSTSSGSPPVLVKPDELLIKVKSAGVNPLDIILKNIAFKYSLSGRKDKPMGMEFSGVVVQLGDKVNTSFHELNSYDEDLVAGDSIYGSLIPVSVSEGAFGDYIVAKVSHFAVLGKVPQGLSFEEAASLSVSSATSFEVLKKYKGPSLRGKNVLILGGGSSIGYFTAQFAKNYFGCAHVVATCSESSKKDVLDAGADLTIDYHKGPEVVKERLLDFVRGHGKFDIIYDAVRDPQIYPYLYDILKTKKEFGDLTIVLGSTNMDYTKVSFLDMVPYFDHIKLLLSSMLRLSNYNVGLFTMSGHKDVCKAVKKLYDDGLLKTRIDSVYSLGDIERALHKVAGGKVKGKVVVQVD